MKDLRTRISELNNIITNDELKPKKNGDTNYKIFDYDPQDRYKVRDYLYNFLYINNQDKIIIIDIYKTIIDILKENDYMDIVIEREKEDGTASANETIQDVLGIGTQEDLLKPKILKKIGDSKNKIVIITGLEGCFQIVRGHTILAILEGAVTNNPIIMFYPGTYEDQQTYRLFNKLQHDNGYNATIIAGRN